MPFRFKMSLDQFCYLFCKDQTTISELITSIKIVFMIIAKKLNTSQSIHFDTLNPSYIYVRLHLNLETVISFEYF